MFKTSTVATIARIFAVAAVSTVSSYTKAAPATGWFHPSLVIYSILVVLPAILL